MADNQDKQKKPQEQWDEEFNDLEEELNHFKNEKERVRTIVGKIGGVPTFNSQLFNVIFITLIIVSAVISLISHGKLSLAMIEIAIAAVSIKLILLMHNQTKVNHFQLWILSALEWRLNEIMKVIKNQQRTRPHENDS